MARGIYLTINGVVRRFGAWRPAPVFDEKTNKVKEGVQRKNESGSPIWQADFVQAGDFGAQVITVTTVSATVPTFDQLMLSDSRAAAAHAKPGFGFGGEAK